MADIFQEVDEEVRREQLSKLWSRYGNYIVALAVLIVVAVAGWRGYQWYTAKKAAEAGAAFESAVALSEANNSKDAAAAFAKIVGEAPAGYRLLARLREAAELAKTDPAAATAKYDAIAADTSVGQTIQDLAALRGAIVSVDTAAFDALKRRLDPITEPGRPFRHSAREVLALSAWRHNDAAAAKKYIDTINGDNETPAGVRSRVEVLSALIAANSKS